MIKQLLYISVFVLTCAWANAQTWEPLGPLGILGTSSVKHSMALDAAGTPYVAFADAVNDQKVTVRRFINNHWETVGNAGFTPDEVVRVQLAIDSAGTPYVAFPDSRNNYRLTVKKFNGTSWNTVGNPGFTAVGASTHPLVIGPAGKPYVAITQQSAKPLVMMFNGNGWETVTTLGMPDDKGIYPAIAFDSYGTLYLVYSSTANQGKINVIKFNGTQWNRVGNANFSNGEANGIKIVIDPEGTPYVLYDDPSTNDKATVKRLNGSTWEDVGQLDPRYPDPGGEPYFPDMALNRDGTPYVTYGGDLAGNKTTVKKFNGELWETVGNPDFTAKQYSFPTISIDDKGTIYLVYSDADLYAFKFETGDVNPTVREFTQASVRAWPNPFSDKLTIEFSSLSNTWARLEIYDAKGVKQKVLFDNPVKVGQLYQWEYVPLQKNNAVLFYRLTLGDQLFTGKLIYMEKK